MQENNSKPHSAEPTISFQGKDKCVNVGKDVIRLLGNPDYISLILSEDGTGLAIYPCEERNLLSFKVPQSFLTADKVQLRIHSKQFVEGVLLSAGLNKDKTYRVKGTFSAEHNAITFQLSDFEGLAKDRIFVMGSMDNKKSTD